MEADQLRSFFAKLAIRFRKENDLSDLTWALCESYPTFRKLFLSFFFNEIANVDGIILEREYTRANSRPDFFFRIDQQEYIIEVKTLDLNDHFEQYKSDFQSVRFGWIANYKMDKQREDGIEIRTWEELKIYFEDSMSLNDIEPVAKTMISGYCEYIQDVCSIVKIKKMTLENLSSLYYFNKLINRIIEKPINNLQTSLYPSAKGINEDRSGKVFQLWRKGTKGDEIYPWFGVYYGSEPSKTTVCIGFSHRWCQKVFNGLIQEPREGNYFTTPYEEEGEGGRTVWIELRQKYFDEFNREESPIRQEEILTNYFQEVMGLVQKYL